MKTKMAAITGLKTDSDAGVFEAIVSVFGNKDSYGDVIIPGAFTNTLAEWAAKDAPIPVYWSHRMDDPDFNIGHVLEAAERPEGLWVRAQLDLASPKGAQVYRLMKGRRVTQFSFAYDVVAGAVKQSEDLGDYYELQELRIHEVGPTPIGANRETELLAVKDATDVVANVAAGIKAGRTISAKNEDLLRTAHKNLSDVLGTLDGQQEQAASDDTDPDKDEASDGKSKVPAVKSSVSLLETELQLMQIEMEG